jgi:ketosteroid isomerase-like protein
MESSESLRAAVLRFFDRFNAGDVEAFDSVVSSGEVLFIGTAPNEWFTDRDRLRRGFEAESFRIEPSDPRGWSEGTMGWATDEPVLDVPSTGPMRTRFSAVFRLEDGEWRLVMSHLSVGVPDETAAALAAVAADP